MHYFEYSSANPETGQTEKVEMVVFSEDQRIATTPFPVDVTQQIEENSDDIAVISKELGLLMIASRGKGAPSFNLLTDDAPGIVDDQVAIDRIKAHKDISHIGYAIELPEPTKRGNIHYSLGHIEDGTYTPLLTVLTVDHPVRQLIEDNKQPQAA